MSASDVGRFASINPATGEVDQEFSAHTVAQVEQRLAGAHTAQQAWARLSFAERAVPMRAAAALLRERAPVLARMAAIEMGKPLKDGLAEVAKCADACLYFAEHAPRLLAPRAEASDATTSYVRFDPLGVVLAIMPWNFPFWQVFRFIGPHLMAGNGGVLKHAPNVPHCALAIEALMADAGFPERLFVNVFLDTPAVAALIADPRIAAVTLTGSERAGRAVAALAGQALKPAVLELGGSDPFIVLADADLPAAAAAAITARMMNAGQSCICAKRFIVEAPVHDAFLAALTTAANAIRVGDPLQSATTMGPLARRDLRDALHEQVTAAIAGGARLVCGGVLPNGPGSFYPPTILADVHPGNPAADEELFGPVATVMRATDAEHALALANATRFGLGASLWTRDQARAESIAAQLQSGAVFINGLVKSDPRLPFGGVKASGFGRELGLEGIRAFVNTKTVWIR